MKVARTSFDLSDYSRQVLAEALIRDIGWRLGRLANRDDPALSTFAADVGPIEKDMSDIGAAIALVRYLAPPPG